MHRQVVSATRALLPRVLALTLAIVVSCGREPAPKAPPAKYVPQQVARVAGVSAEMVQAAITARVDSQPARRAG